MQLIIRRKKKLNRSLLGDLLLFAFLGLVGAFMAMPLVYVVNNAFKPLDELFLFPPRFFVRNPTFANFGDLFNLMANSWVPFSRYIFNTVFVTVAGTAGHLIVASAAAYPLAKYKFPGSGLLFHMVVLSLMFSATITAVPNYLIMSGLDWINTYWAIIIPAMGYPLGMYLMKQFMEQLPDALMEAAKIDGASEYRIFWSIVMPNVKPAWLTLIILLMQQLWVTDGGLFIFDEQMKTMHFALGQLVLGGLARAGVGAAVALLLMSVPLILFILSQAQILQTMTTSGMKD